MRAFGCVLFFIFSFIFLILTTNDAYAQYGVNLSGYSTCQGSSSVVVLNWNIGNSNYRVANQFGIVANVPNVTSWTSGPQTPGQILVWSIWNSNAMVSNQVTIQNVSCSGPTATPTPAARPNLWTNNVVLRRDYTGAGNCSSGVVIQSGHTVADGTVMEMCIVGGNNGTAAAGAYQISNYVHQPVQPQYGAAAWQTFNLSGAPIGPLSYSQAGTITANRTTCSSNCRGAFFIDSANQVNETSEVDNFALSVPYNVKLRPENVIVDIAPEPINANGAAQYTISATAQDAEGGNDIATQQVIINYQGANAGQYRGRLGWTAADWWSSSAKAGSYRSCSPGGGFGMIFGDAGFGPQYVNLISCSTSVSGNQRISVFTVTFNPLFAQNGPQVGNRISEYVTDWGSLPDIDGWQAYDIFDLAQPPTSTPTNTPTPAPCQVTTSPASLTMNVNGTAAVSASVTSGLGSASIVQMRFGSYNTTIATVSPTSDSFSPYQTTVTARAAGSTAVWATADLSDGRSCPTSTSTDTNVTVNGPTSTPTNTPTPTRTPTPTVSCVPGGVTLSGNVYIDNSATQTCSSSTSYNLTSATVTLRQGGIPTGSDAIDGSGFYTINDTSSCGLKSATLSGLAAGYTVTKVSLANSCEDTTLTNEKTFNLNANTDLDWFVSNVAPWWQTSGGDVRFGNLVNPVPGPSSPTFVPGSLDTVFFSSNSTADFGNTGTPPTWVVNQELSQGSVTSPTEPKYNDDPKTKTGLFSYTFFVNRANIKSVPMNQLPAPCLPAGNCTLGAFTLPTGIYHLDGNLTINGLYTHTPGAHVTILVKGTVTINTNLKVPQNAANLFIIASRGNITFANTVGEVAPFDSTNTNAEGIFTSEGSIILDSFNDNCVTSDRRFNLAGNFVTNSLKPFRVGGTGIFVNNRSLCAADGTRPVFTIVPRYDFITQLTDFYKAPSVRWREVNP